MTMQTGQEEPEQATVPAGTEGADSAPSPDAPSGEVTPQDEGAPTTDSDLQAILDGITDEAVKQRVTERWGQLKGDYTQKTQELAEERSRLSSYAQFGEAFEKALEEDPAQAAQMLENLRREIGDSGAADLAASTDGAGSQQVDYGPMFNRSPEELQSLIQDMTPQEQLFAQQLAWVSQKTVAADQTATQIRETTDRERIEQGIRSLHEKHGDFDEAKLIRTAINYKLTDLNAAYALAFPAGPVSREELERQIRQKVYEELKQRSGIGPPGGTTTPGQPAPQLKSHADVMAEAARRVGGSA